MTLKIVGTVKSNGPTQVKGVGMRQFATHPIVIAVTDGGKVQYLSLEASGNIIETCKNIPLSMPVTCQVRLTGREWKDPKTDTIKYFNSLKLEWIEPATNVNFANTPPQQGIFQNESPF